MVSQDADWVGCLACVEKANMNQLEYSASDIRKILQQIFPQRRLVLSQFTFFNQVGVAKASGNTFRRGRRCYLLEDILSIACVLALKEEGIPLKNILQVPSLVQANATKIFGYGEDCRLSGYGDVVELALPGEPATGAPLAAFLDAEATGKLFWSYDVGLLAKQLERAAQGVFYEEVRIAA